MVKLLEAGPRLELPLNNRPDKEFYAGGRKGGGLSFHFAESEMGRFLTAIPVNQELKQFEGLHSRSDNEMKHTPNERDFTPPHHPPSPPTAF